MSLLALYGLWLRYRNQLLGSKRFLKLMIAAIALPFLANATGWILTEVGRQPWIVYGLMRIEEAVSPNVTVGMMAISLGGFTLLYGVLAVADFYLLQKYARGGNSDGEMFPQPTLDPSDDASTDEDIKLEGAY
jgi:cytochrome d ubiquinol oxidase subunit I